MHDSGVKMKVVLYATELFWNEEGGAAAGRE
jgi:hypothetical protein